jgi:hypothetical protein
MTANVHTLGPGSIITDPNRILAYQMRHYSAAPKSALNVTQSLAVSLTYTVSYHQNKTQEELCSAIESEVTSMFNNIFGSESANVLVRSSPLEDIAGGHLVAIAVSVTYEGRTYTFTDNVKLDGNGYIVYADYNEPEII